MTTAPGPLTTPAPEAAPTRLPLLPEGACLLHIGPYKTGSTAIQSALHNARDQLGRYGVRYAGRGTRDRRAGWAVLDRDPRGREAPRIDEWNALAREVRQAAHLRVCLSNEDFARASFKQARRIVEDLGPDRVHVIVVARRFDRLLPSQWQERVKCHETVDYENFLREVLAEESTHPVHRAFWASHGIERVAARWLPLVGADQFTVVVTDDSDRTLLLRTFEQMLGLPEELLELDSRSNPSLPANGVEFLRRLNEAFESDESLTDAAYFNLVQRGGIAKMKYAPRSGHDDSIPRLPDWAAERLAGLSRQRVDAIRALGVQVVGDLESLLTPGSGAEALPAPPEVMSLDAAVWAVHGVVDAALRQQRKAEQQQAHRVRRGLRSESATGRDAAASPEQLPVAATRSVDLLRVIGRRALRRVRARS